jgi:ribonuclease-3
MSESAEPTVDAVRAVLTLLVGPGDVPRLVEALTHPSYANESGLPDNQRLEFLGDSVLGLCVSEILSLSFPEADEGTLTRMRAALVNADALSRWARSILLGDALFLGRGARAGGEGQQTNVLSDAVEAIVAAVYEAHGLAGARKVVHEIIREPLAAVTQLGERDPKSQLQERVQGEGQPPPEYKIKEARGPQHDPTFVVEVHVGGTLSGTGEGKSKRAAERAAAQAALVALQAAEIPAAESPTEPST